MSFIGRAWSAFAEIVYRSARRSRSEDWSREPTTGDAAIHSSIEELLLRSRDLALNAGAAKAMADTLSDMIIGQGMLCVSSPFEETILDVIGGDLGDEQIFAGIRYVLENAVIFDEWSERESADTEQDSTWQQLERLACYELINSGNAIILRTFHDPSEGRYLPVSYSVIEQDQIDLSRDGPTDNGGRIQNGWLFDARGRKLGLYVYVEHPGDPDAVSLDSELIPMDRLIHAYLRLRPTQRVGEPWHQTAFSAIQNGTLYLGSELKAAAHQAVVSWVLNSPRHGNFRGFNDGLTNEDAYGNQKVKLGQAAIAKLGPDEKLEAVETKKAATNPEPFLDQIRIDQGQGAGVSPNRLTRDYRNHSYTSARASHLDDDAHFQPLQQWFAKAVSIPIRREVTMIAVALGRFQSVTVEQFMRNQRIFQRYEALGPGRGSLNPDVETEASISRLRAGLSTLAFENAKQQHHWLRVLIQRALETRVAGALGVFLDFSKGGGQSAQPGATTTDESEQVDSEA